MDTMFTNSENSKTYYPHTLLLNLADKVVKVAQSNCSTYYT